MLHKEDKETKVYEIRQIFFVVKLTLVKQFSLSAT